MALFEMVNAPGLSTLGNELGLASSKRIRLFAAINLPEAIKTALDKNQRDLVSRITSGSVRLTRQVHLTLKFFGYVEESSTGELKMALTESCRGIAPFELNANGLGCFPTARSPRVIWARVAGELGPLLGLQKRLEEATVKWAEREQREFAPHLTLARVKEPRASEARTIASFIEAHKKLQFGRWRVDRLDLMQSVLSCGGATYDCIGSIALSERAT